MIEHVSDVVRTMEEFHRLVRAGGEIYLATPHYTDFSSFCDPTHKWHLNSFSLRYFGPDHGGYSYYTDARFEEKVYVKLLSLWKYLGFEWLINASPRLRRYWEYYFCYIIRGKVIEWRLDGIEVALMDPVGATIVVCAVILLTSCGTQVAPTESKSAPSAETASVRPQEDEPQAQGSPRSDRRKRGPRGNAPAATGTLGNIRFLRHVAFPGRPDSVRPQPGGTTQCNVAVNVNLVL